MDSFGSMIRSIHFSLVSPFDFKLTRDLISSPHNGQNITRDNLMEALTDVYGLSNAFAGFFTDGALNAFGEVDESQTKFLPNLTVLNTPHRLEHDASLTRKDQAIALRDGDIDNLKIDQELITKVEAASADGQTLTISDFAKLRRERYAESLRETPEFKNNWSAIAQTAAFGEAALMLLVFGDGSSVPLQSVKSVFADEKLPADFVKPAKDSVTWPRFLKTIARIRIKAGWSA